MKEPRIKIKDLWRNLRNAGQVTFSYSSLLKWADSLQIERSNGLTEEEADRLTQYSLLKTNTLRSITAANKDKAAHLQDLWLKCRENGGNGRMRGSEFVTFCELRSICSRASIYRRSKRLGYGAFDARNLYEYFQMQNFLIGEFDKKGK